VNKHQFYASSSTAAAAEDEAALAASPGAGKGGFLDPLKIFGNILQQSIYCCCNGGWETADSVELGRPSAVGWRFIVITVSNMKASPPSKY
jgi:hypothetical protein